MSYKRENIIGQMERNLIRLACNVVTLWQNTYRQSRGGKGLEDEGEEADVDSGGSYRDKLDRKR